MTALDARGLTRTYPATKREPAVHALRELTLAINPGEHVALLGPNGAGKSTLLRLITGLEAPDAGDLTVLETTPDNARARLGVVFQKPALDPLLTVRENLALAADLYAISNKDERTEAVASQLDITGRLDSRVAALSGGLARRADLARALVPAPDLLLLDEPTTGLDHAARASFLDALDQRRAENHSLTILMSTHLMDEAQRAERVVLIDRGALIADDAPDALRRSISSAAILRAPLAARSALEAARLHIAESAGALAATGDEDQLRAAASELLAANIPFEIAPPTLGDVYLKLTGRALAAADRSDEEPAP